MANTHDFKRYKESKIILPQLETILKILRLTESGLKHYNMYIPVAKVLVVVREQISILECHLTDLKKVKSSKGLKT